MKFIRTFFILAAAVLGFSAADAQAQRYVGSNGVPLQGIERKVFREIIRLPYYGVFDNIAFKVENDTVTLYGKVINATNRKSAERVVERIEGVSNVINNIEILPLSSFDNDIRRQVVNQFLQRGGSLYRYVQGVNPSMRIIVDRGHVSLEGFVANRSDANLARILANVPGAFSVTNNLIVESELPR